jgi:glycosyltransferase involved in cell wall biosynthesis
MPDRLVTVAVPVYRNLRYLANTIGAIRAQDYPLIDFMLSDNGQNGDQVKRLGDEVYGRPYRFRQSAEPLPGFEHFNCLLREARGEFFVLLCEDDEISPNYVSALLAALERYPQARLAISKQMAIDETGQVVTPPTDSPPPLTTGEESLKMYCLGKHCLTNPTTLLARTEDLRRHGGYQYFTCGLFDDYAMFVKLCLGTHVAFSAECSFRWRKHKEALGQSSSHLEVAQACRDFLAFLRSDPYLLAYAEANPRTWVEVRAYLVRFTWHVYHWSWLTFANSGAPLRSLIRDAVVFPLVPAYYARVIRSLGGLLLRRARRRRAKP